MRILLAAFFSGIPFVPGVPFVSPTYAAGTLNVALQQQFAFTGCSTAANVCGTPLIGGLLYFYQVGTASTRQDSFQDTALSVVNPWPLVLDANGRIPMFYLADGSIHVRLTDAGGVVQFDIPSTLVVGPSGGGGGGAGVDATAIASTGDIKFRMTSESLQSWTKLNGQKIGIAGAAGADLTGAQYQNLYNYLWTNCPNTHCAVQGGRGATGNADWNAGKNLQLPDWRGRGPMGLDDMGSTVAGRIPNSSITSGGGDLATTPGATGGNATHTQTESEMAAHSHPGSSATSSSSSPSVTSVSTSIADGRTWGFGLTSDGGSTQTGGGRVGFTGGGNTPVTVTGGTISAASTASTSTTTTTTTTLTIAGDGSGTPFDIMTPFILGTWYIRL
jgi:hypothetical protein